MCHVKNNQQKQPLENRTKKLPINKQINVEV